MMNRREFPLALMGQAAVYAQGARRGLKRLSEVSASLYPWDLVDEGVEPILETLKETTGANSTYLVALMHEESARSRTFTIRTIRNARRTFRKTAGCTGVRIQAAIAIRRSSRGPVTGRSSKARTRWTC